MQGRLCEREVVTRAQCLFRRVPYDYVAHRSIPETGDIFVSVLTGGMMNGRRFPDSPWTRATRFIELPLKRPSAMRNQTHTVVASCWKKCKPWLSQNVVLKRI